MDGEDVRGRHRLTRQHRPRSARARRSAAPLIAVGENAAGLQINLPFSKQQQDFYFHWNTGLTWRPRGENADLTTPFLSASAIYRLRPMLNAMLESVLVWEASEVDRTDGLKLLWPARQEWLHLRKSGTEPIVRLIAEAPDVDAAERLVARARELAAAV